MKPTRPVCMMSRMIWDLFLAWFFFSAMIASPLHAQTSAEFWVQRWGGNFDDHAYAIAVDANGDVVVTGSAAVNTNITDFLTIKYSNAGVPLWTNRYHGTLGGYYWGNAVRFD